MKEKKMKPDELSNAALQPLIDHCEKRAGVSEVIKIYKEITGIKPNPADFYRWLNPDKKERVQPRLGVGLILVEIHKRLSAAPKVEGAK